MSGERISAAARALRVFLLSLPQSCHFNIIKFGSRHTTLFGSGPRAYTEETLAEAMRLCDSLSANLGGTELLQPLETIFGRKVSNGKNRQVFILTDGQVSNTEQVIECCRQNAHNSRVFTVGIGNDVSRALVEGMARAADGTAEFIVGAELKGSSAALELKIINQLKIATMPAISKVMVDWGVLGTLAPPSYDAVLAAAAEGSGVAGISSTEAAASVPAAPTAATGENSLATFAVSCGDTQLGEQRERGRLDCPSSASGTRARRSSSSRTRARSRAGTAAPRCPRASSSSSSSSRSATTATCSSRRSPPTARRSRTVRR
jgi:hypothetical protein